MADRLKGKVAVVTGAGRGIGRATALLMAEEGARVVVNDFGGALNGYTDASTLPADQVVAEIERKGGKAVANYDSVATAEGGDNIIKTAVDNFGRIDILVNNAGNRGARMIFNMTPEEWDAVIKVHLYGTFHCTRPAAALMRQQRSGRIINISSSAAWEGIFGGTNYSAAKAGVYGFTRSCALELGRYGVTVNCIGPEARTRFQEAVSTALASYTSTTTPVQEVGEPEDVALIVAYLATDDAANINGNYFGVNGGNISLYCTLAPVKSIHKMGRWTLDELSRIVPTTLAVNLVNPPFPQPPKQ